MRNTTLTALLGLALACTFVFTAPTPASASPVGATVADTGSWSPLALWQDLQDWWTALVGTPDHEVKRGVEMDPNCAPTATTTADFPTDTERGLVIDPDGAS